MKIIKDGSTPKTWKGECPFCGCEYEYEASDVYTEYTLSCFTTYSVTCPWCGCKNYANSYSKIMPSYGDIPGYKSWDITCTSSGCQCEDVPSKPKSLQNIMYNETTGKMVDID